MARKRIVSLVLCMLLTLVLGVGALAQEQLCFTPGTYTGSAAGRNGSVTVAVTVDETSILSVEMTEHRETSGVAAAAIRDMNDKIVGNQSLAVDATTGATLTGYAIRNAAKKALEQSGADMALLEKKLEPVEKTAAQDEAYDIVIVGGGAGGLAAAIELGRNNPELSVLVLEKAAFTGGDFGFSGGGVSVIGSRYNQEIGMDLTVDELMDFFKMRAGEHVDQFVPGLGENALALWGNTFDYLIESGLPLTTQRGIVSWDLEAAKMSFAASDDETGGTFEVIMNSGSPEKIRKGVLMFTHPTLSSPETSQALVGFMTQHAVDLGAEIRLNSKGTDLIVENGAVVGVSVEDPTKTYNVMAKKVILATGGINNNKEMIAKYASDIEGAIVRGCSGATGDAITMTEDLDTVVNGYGFNGMCCVDILNAYDTSIGAVYGTSGLWVNINGERFCDERGHIYNTGFMVHQQPEHVAYNLFDSTSVSVEKLENGLAQGIGYKADTIEELAALSGIDVEGLMKTIELYNADYAAGGDSVMGLNVSEMTPLKEGPFYAVPMRYLNLGVMVGLLSDENCAIVNSEGNAIPNLYGCGYVVAGNIYGNRSPASGMNLGTAFSTGTLAARNAAAEIE